MRRVQHEPGTWSKTSSTDGGGVDSSPLVGRYLDGIFKSDLQSCGIERSSKSSRRKPLNALRKKKKEKECNPIYFEKNGCVKETLQGPNVVVLKKKSR